MSKSVKWVLVILILAGAGYGLKVTNPSPELHSESFHAKYPEVEKSLEDEKIEYSSFGLVSITTRGGRWITFGLGGWVYAR